MINDDCVSTAVTNEDVSSYVARALQAFRPGLTPSMIRGYASRGRTLARGTDELGRPPYRIGDLIEPLNERIAG